MTFLLYLLSASSLLTCCENRTRKRFFAEPVGISLKKEEKKQERDNLLAEEIYCSPRRENRSNTYLGES